MTRADACHHAGSRFGRRPESNPPTLRSRTVARCHQIRAEAAAHRRVESVDEGSRRAQIARPDWCVLRARTVLGRHQPRSVLYSRNYVSGSPRESDPATPEEVSVLSRAVRGADGGHILKSRPQDGLEGIVAAAPAVGKFGGPEARAVPDELTVTENSRGQGGHDTPDDPSDGSRCNTGWGALLPAKLPQNGVYEFMPDGPNMVDWLAGKKVFSFFDLKDGFFQVELDDSSKPLTAIGRVLGLLQYTRLPMGMKNSPGTSQRIINMTLRSRKGEDLLVSMDYMGLGTEDEDSHLVALESLLDCLHQNGVRLSLSKCQFGVRSA